jgi:uncharacterized membrane protein YidH (DUF202 family)
LEGKKITEVYESKKPSRVINRRVHMANERTFLAWIRTSIGIMAFGFVVEKFALFLKQVTYFLGKTDSLQGRMPGSSQGYSSVLGVILVALGAIMGVLAFARYKKVERQIDEETFQPSILLDILLTISILAVGVFLVFILLHSM